MKILVANLGSTSFKHRLFDMDAGRQLARGAIERIGSTESRCTLEIGPRRQERTLRVADHAEAVRLCLAQLTDPESGCLKDAAEVSAIAFKTVHGGVLSGVRRVTPEVIAAMERLNFAAPAHNPPYVKAMRLLREKLPQIPLIACFETAFHATIPDRNRFYAVPYEWAADGLVRRWGFHGASHRYIAGRTAELLGRDDLRIISCHLGGSSSLCAIRNGQSVATSMGMSAAERLAAEQPLRRFRRLCHPPGHGADGQVARRSPRRAGQPGRTARTQRREQRFSRHRGGGRRGQRPCAVGRRRLRLGGATQPWGLSRRAGRRRRDRLHRRDRRKRRRSPRRRLRATSKNWAFPSTPPPTPPPRAKQRSVLPAAACRFGSCRPTRNSLSPARPHNSCKGHEPCLSPKSPARWSARRRSMR